MSRINSFRERMIKEGIDAVVIYDELNQRYLSTFDFTDGLLLITRSTAHLITDFRYYEMATKKADKEFNIVTPEDKLSYVKDVLNGEACKTLGFEGGFVSYAQYQRLKKVLADIEFTDIKDMVEELRQVKSEEEISAIKKAQIITDLAFKHVLKMLDYNMTELDVAVELEYAMRKNGAEGFAFDTIAVSGTSSALPHGTPRPVKLEKGFLTMDYGAKIDGYCSDMTRTVVIGKADAEMKKLYNTVLKAQLSALDYLREGADCAQADKIARDIIDVDYSGRFGHSLGHSVGLFIHETPALSKRYAGRALRVGEVVTCEPGIYLFGKYGCRIEDMVAIEKNGVYNFTESPKELIEI